MADELVLISSVIDQYINQVADPATRMALRVLSDRTIDTSTGVVQLSGAGAPTSGTSGTGVGLAGVGSTYTNTTDGQIYVNTNTLASPTWSVVAPIGITASVTELNYNDITTLGIGAAGKSVVLDSGEDFTWPTAGIFTYGVLKDPAGTTLTSTVAELNYNDITTLGIGAANKAVVLDSAGDFVFPTAGIFTYGVLKDPAGTTLGATIAEINNAADVSGFSQTLTVSGAITPGKKTVLLNHATALIAATIADASLHCGLFSVKAGLEPGAGQDHTCTITTGTWDGTNKIATFADINDALVVFFDQVGNGSVVVNVGAVALS